MKNFIFDAVCIEQTYTKFRKQLDERQGIQEALLKNIQNCSYDNIVVNGSHKADKVSFEDPKSPHEKFKMISNKSNQVEDDDNQNDNDNQKTISKTEDEQSMTLDKRIDKINPTAVGLLVKKLPKKKQKSRYLKGLVIIRIRKVM